MSDARVHLKGILMYILPYRGPERTFISQLDLQECVYRLQREVEPSVLNDVSGWARMAADSAVMRRVSGTTFSLYKAPRPTGGVMWTFDGTLLAEGDRTRIRGRYHLQFPYQAFVLLTFVLTLILAGYALADVLRNGLTSQNLLSDTVVFLLVPWVLIALFVWRNRVEDHNEIYLAEFLARFFQTHKHTS